MVDLLVNLMVELMEMIGPRRREYSREGGAGVEKEHV
jgi:hypothetical protein